MTQSQEKSLVAESRALFQQAFQQPARVCVTAPGRVNLMGGHVDYNEGFVLPAAIDKSIAVCASPRDDRQLAMVSADYRDQIQVPLSALAFSKEHFWSNYVQGVAFFLQQQGHPLRGANLLIKGNIPPGAGLSSSAALEVAAGYAFKALNHLSISELEMVKLCRKVENDFVGVQCGIMDQLISAVGKKNHALLLDCRSLDYEYIPVPRHASLLICDTGLKRELAGSEYNRRRQACQATVDRLSKVLPGIRTLRDVTPGQLEAHAHLLDETLRKRSRHVVTEVQRTKESAALLRKGDLAAFGSLMFQSHLSLKNDYEVSCPELDTIVDLCAQCDGVYGARLTGAGFGGSVVCLAQDDCCPRVLDRLSNQYGRLTHRSVTLCICNIASGVAMFD
ncbi:MAG: galactokinase [bacterium]